MVRRNGFLKREVILRSSLLSSVNIFDGSSECAVFQNLVPEVYVQQLSLQASISQKFKTTYFEKGCKYFISFGMQRSDRS